VHAILDLVDDDDAPETYVDGDEAATGATRREGKGVRKRAGDDEHLPPNTQIGRYVVEAVLGAGGMGIVYTAFDPELDRKVAVKLLQARPGHSGSGGQNWLMREAQAMARLQHPNVVAVHDVGAMPGDRVFVAMELVDGQTLRAWLREKTPSGMKRSWREVLPVLRAAGAGLAAAHAAGLVHRDFKPDNVLVGRDGRVRVTDFGLARLHGPDLGADPPGDSQLETKSPLSERLTAAGAMLGTPAYMAPEIYAGSPADMRSDQFAFGVALYEALYRERPFDRTALVEQRAVAPTPPATAQVPAWLERVVLRAIALDPAARFASMDELLAAIDDEPKPPRRWRYAALGGAVIAVAAIAIVAAQMHGAPRELPCTDAASKLAGVWDVPARVALEAAFRQIKRPYVDDVIRGTEKTLDAYAAGWVAQRTEACRATRVQGDQSEDVLTLRMACLDRRRTELATLAGLFAHADEQLVQGAVGAAQKLSALADCADVPALLAPDPLPKDPIARAQISALQTKLAEARATYKASRPKDTLAMTAALGPEVERVKHLPTEAEWHLLAGQSMWVLQGADKGEPELMKAALAADAGKADQIKVEAWLQLTNLANESSKFDVAEERLQQATAALARLGTNWDLQVRVTASGALLESRENHIDKALVQAKQARAIAEQHTEAPSYAYALLVEGSILSAALRAQESLDDFKKVLAYQDTLGHRRIEVAATLQTMATSEMLLGKLDDAIAHSNDAIDIDVAIYGPDNLEVARGLAGLGAEQARKGDLAAALASQQRALAIAEHVVGSNADYYATILGQIAETLIGLDRAGDAIDYLDRALAIQTAKLGPTHVQTLTVMLTRCEAFHAASKFADAIAACEHTLQVAQQALGADSPILFLFYSQTGIALYDGKRAKAAVAMFDHSLKLGTTDPSDLYFVAFADAHALWDSGNHNRALELASQARDGFAKLGNAKRDQLHDVDDWLSHHRR
jgi:eukaryotic-like serine/threonine-protein kinase